MDDRLYNTGKLLRRRTWYNVGYHWGIMLFDGSVVHWPEYNVPPLRDTLENFACGIPVTAIPYRSKYTKEQVAKRALSLVGRKDLRFRIFTDNCESLVRWCIEDRWISEQGMIAEISAKVVFSTLGLRDKLYRNRPTIWDILLFFICGSCTKYIQK
jgi:hypothetical protein